MKTFRLPLLAMAAIVACSYSNHADALSYVMMRDEALLESAHGVAVVTVMEALPSQDGEQQTFYRVRVEKSLAGAGIDKKQLVALPGTWSAPNINFVVPGVPRLVVGGTYLLFYSESPDGTLDIPQLSLGIFRRVDLDKHSVYVRDLRNAREIGAKETSATYHSTRDADGFEHWIAERAKGVERETDYMRPEIAIPLEKYSLFQFTIGTTTRPARWFQFDDGQIQQWYAHPSGQTGATFDEFTALQSALAGWNDDQGSRISMAYAGTANAPQTCPTGAGNQVSDFTNSACFSGFVEWNNLSEFADAEPGVLAVAGASAVSITGEASGQTWYTLYSARMWVRAGAETYLNGDGGTNAIEVFTHEVGHTLGFGHSCGDNQTPSCNTDPLLDAATMRAVVHGDGRGATLGIDDQAAAAFAYPDPDAVPPSADLSITSSASSSVPNPGATVSFTITVSNAGPDSAADVQVANTTPSGLTFVSNSGDCTTAFPCSLGTLTSGEQGTITSQYTVSAGATDGQQITHTVTVSSAVDDPDATDDSDASTLTVDVPAGGATCDGDCVFRSGFEPGET